MMVAESATGTARGSGVAIAATRNVPEQHVEQALTGAGREGHGGILGDPQHGEDADDQREQPVRAVEDQRQ